MSGALRNRFKLNDHAYATMVATVTTFPHYNYLLVGPQGAGKSTLQAILFDRALKKWAKHSYEYNLTAPAVWKTTARALLNEHIDWATRPKGDDAPYMAPPMITEDAIKIAVKPENAFVPHVSIEEFDKYKMSSDEFQNPALHSIIDACWSAKGQVVGSSNIDIEWLTERLGPQFGGPMLRRMIDAPTGVYINFWRGTVYVNMVRHVLQDGALVPVPGDTIEIPDEKAPGAQGRSGGPPATGGSSASTSSAPPASSSASAVRSQAPVRHAKAQNRKPTTTVGGPSPNTRPKAGAFALGNVGSRTTS